MRNDLRVAVIVALVRNAQTRLGKTQVQKLVYFAQDSGIPLNYEYEIYHYGPYSFELSHDLGSLDSLGIVNVASEPSGYGFDISVGRFSEKFKLETKYQKRVDKVLEQFGLNSAAQLEVKATIHFVHSVIKSKIPAVKVKAEVVQKVLALKPRYTEEFVRGCYAGLEEAHWI